MPPPSTPSLTTTLATSLALIDQFISSLNSPTTTTNDPTNNSPSNHPSPLQLLTAAATSLRSTVTKVSLLTITTPFTPTAIASTLSPLNSSILPSLVTATLLTTPTNYPTSFSTECTHLVRACLRDLQLLLLHVKSRSESPDVKSSLPDSDKKSVTEATGKVWEDCDLIVQLGNEGVPGFVVRKAKQWLELMRDAVKELEEWDPEEEDVEDQDWLGLGSDGDDDDDDDDDDENNNDEEEKKDKKEKDGHRAVVNAGVKDQALKVLSRIPQSVHVVVKQRLEKMSVSMNATAGVEGQSTTVTPINARVKKTLNLILSKTRSISDCIDESAEAMYMGDPELCLKKAGEARALTVQVVESVVEPWESEGGGDADALTSPTKEDLYIKRALLWIQQVDASSTTA